MGGKASKLKKHLQRGDEYAALQVCEKHPDLKKFIDPNMPYSQTDGITPLHHAAQLAMKGVIRIFLNDLDGNPNKRTRQDATSLHLVCQSGTRLNRTLEAQIRADCLTILLSWLGPRVPDMEQERPDINAQDHSKNTALHYAASAGLKRCVEILVAHGAELTLENAAKETACDAAEKAAQTAIAQFLEARMLFSPGQSRAPDSAEALVPVVEAYSGLKEQDLIEAKDLLLVETSDMLQVPLFTAEALLRNHEWSRQSLWTAWNRDPVKCCDKCGVQAPQSALNGPLRQVEVDSELSSENIPSLCLDALDTTEDEGSDVPCEICAEELSGGVRNGECGHFFCRDCWKQYATGKIESGDLAGMSCPAFECPKLVPLDLVEAVVSPDVARKYLTFDIKAFVASNPRIKWCPSPGCANAVRLPESDEAPPPYVRAFPRLQPPPSASRAVACPLGHVFCWDCLSDGHEPTSCERWKDWHARIKEVKPEELSDTGCASETAANCLWLVTNSKPCPKCRSPIQKNEGCNHMKCSKCKQDFCWVCLGQWKKHSSETGGYFRCNRYDDTKKIESKTDVAIAQAKEESRKAAELNRFVHYYSRFKNHLNSFAFEKGLLHRLPSKVEVLANSAYVDKEDASDLSFVRVGIEELLRSRRALSSSYAYGYFLKDSGYNKTIFEYLQNELEVSVEALSGLVGRAYLRGSRGKICHTTHLVGSRRQRFLACISRGLVPPETPPGLRKSKRRNLPAILGLDKDDDDWVAAGLPPLEALDPRRPWVKDGRGRHHNLAAILDWPEDETEEAKEEPLRCTNGPCPRAKAVNPRTKELQNFCSLRCQAAANSPNHGGESGAVREYNVDLMLALQMSRLQLLQDLRRLQDEEAETPGSSTAGRFASSSRAPAGPPEPKDGLFFDGEDMDPDIQLAIERSVSDLSWARRTLSDGAAPTVELLIRGIAEKGSVDSSNGGANVFHEDEEEKNSDKVLIAKVKM